MCQPTREILLHQDQRGGPHRQVIQLRGVSSPFPSFPSLFSTSFSQHLSYITPSVFLHQKEGCLKCRRLVCVNIRMTTICGKKSLSCLKNSFCQNCGTILRYVRLYAFGVHVFMLVCVYIIVKVCLYRSIL